MNFYLSSIDLKKIIIRTTLALLLGLVFCIFPDTSARIFVIILGGAVLFIGIVSFLSIFTFKEGRPMGINYFNLVLSLILGIALLVKPDFFINLLMILLGIILAIAGIGQILSLASVRKWNIRPSIGEYLLGVVLLALGVFICCMPDFSNATLFFLFGLGAIFYSVTNLAVLLHIRKKIKKSGKKIINGNIEDAEFVMADED